MKRWIVTGSCLLVLAVAGPAAARSHRVEPGETLVQIAKTYGCTVAALQKANNVDTTLIRAGRTLKVPTCKAPRKARTRVAARVVEEAVVERDAPGQSVGAPWRGRLRSPTRLVAGTGYTIRRPHRAFAAAHTVRQLSRALAAFRAKFPKAHTVAIGDLSAKAGGPISDHRSHQSGRDVDVGLVFKRKPAGYPASFVDGNAKNLDLAATWGLLLAFVRTADEATGVSNVFLDFDVQGLLYEWAKAKGVDVAYLDKVFQYPHGRGASRGLVRHEPKHADHLHVRFKCAPEDKSCD